MKNRKKTITLMLVAIITLLVLIIGATYAYFQATSNTGSDTDVNVLTATSDLLTFKIDKDINIIVSQSDFKKGAGNKSDSTKASAILTASNSKNIESSSDRYNIYFIIEANDFIYTTDNATAEILLNVTDPNGNKVENITGLVHTDKGFDITTRTGGFLLVPDYDITATRGNTTTQEWKVEVTLVNLDTDQNKNTGKTLSGKLYVTKEKMSSYELTKITNIETETTYNSIKTTLQVANGTSPIEKYYYGIEKISSDATGYANNNSLKRLAFNDVSLIESDKPTYTFKNLEDNATYKIYSYGIDKNKIKTNMYETEVTTNSYNVAKINSVTHTSTLNSITLNVNAQKGDNEIEKYFYSKDNGETYIESTSSTYTFDNLTDTTEYKIKVKVLDSYGRYSTEYLEAIATTTYILPSVTKVSPTTKYNQITVTTTGTKGTNEISKYYYSINNSSYVEGPSTYTFTNLNEQTTYTIKVKVEDTNGRMSNEYSLSATTDAYKLPTITNVTTTSTLNSITINVTGQNGYGTITEYYYSKDNGSNYVKSTNSSYTFTNLTSNTIFYIKVYVKDSNGRDSSEFIIRTLTKQLTIANYCSSGTDLATCVKNFGNQGPDISSIYIHNSTLTNGAEDNSYRYAGGDYVLTEAGKATGATMMIGYDKYISTALIDYYCESKKQMVGYTASSCSDAHYYLVRGDTTQYQTYNEALDASVEKGYLIKDNVKNFVCFGSNAIPCPTENLYRIIGVFNNQVKLIKYDYAKSRLLGTDGAFKKEDSTYWSAEQGESPSSNSQYYWNSSNDKNTWSESNLNKVNLNTNFIRNIGTTWVEKIAVTTWKIGGGMYTYLRNSVPKTAYQKEIVNPATAFTTDNATTYDAKIGLMYLTDYYYSAIPSAWTLVGWSSSSDYTKTYASAKGENWLYGGGYEWTISRNSDDYDESFNVAPAGTVFINYVYRENAVRPTFNLLSSITYVSGDGTIENPIRIN